MLLFFLSFMSRLLAQPYCEMRMFNIRDGLLGNVISGIAEDKNHLMWFTTWNGLCYYDGYQFTSFRDMRDNSRVLTTNRLLHLYADRNGNVWATTYDLRIYMFDTRLCRFIDVSGLAKEKYGSDLTSSKFMRGAKGTVWALSEDDEQVGWKMDGNLVAQSQGLEKVAFDKTPLKGAKIKRVSVDDKDREWVFTDKGIYLYNTKTVVSGRFDNMINIGGKIYFYSKKGTLAVFDEHSQKARMLVNNPRLIFNKVRTMGDQCLVIGTNQGIFIYDLQTGSHHLASVQNPAQPCPEVDDIYLDSKKRVWAFGKGPGVTMLEMTTLKMKWMNETSSESHFSSNEGSVLFHEDNNHTIWLLPHSSSFCYYDEHTQTLHPYTLRLQGSSTTPFMTLKKVFKDSQGNMWIAGNHDLALLNFKYRQFRYAPLDNQDSEVRSVLTLHNGNQLVGTANGYVCVLGKQKDQLGFLTAAGSLSKTPARLTDSKVMTFLEDHKGRIWIGTRGDGIYLLNGNTMTHYRNSGAFSLSNDNVFDIYQDSRQHIWVGTWSGGINLVDEQHGGLRFLSATQGGLDSYPADKFPRVRRFTETRQGVMILSTATGMVTFSTRFTNPSKIKYFGQFYDHNDTTTLATGDVMQTCVMRNGHIFVSTQGGGLQELESRDLLQPHLKFSTVNTSMANGTEGMAQAMVEDRSGRLWICHESDISVYDPKTRKLQQFGPNYLGDNRELSEAKPDVNRWTGNITFGALGGVVVFNPSSIRNSSYVPKIVFTSIQYQGEEREHPILNVPELRVASDKRNFNINFAALDYNNNYMVRYAYKLEGVDKEWNYLGSHLHSASYNNFPAGHYKLLVRSTNGDGVWTENTAVLNIYAQPTFWETIWAKILYVLILIGILYAVKRYYEMRNKTQLLHETVNQLLEEYNNRNTQVQEKAEETKEQADIYHLPPSEILDSDEQMMMKLMDFLTNNVGNSELKIEELAEAVNLSRSVFYSKLKAKVGMTPVEFLKHIRIQKAEELITKSNESFSQIAYAVGFTDPKYFTKCFKKSTGMTPSEYRQAKK